MIVNPGKTNKNKPLIIAKYQINNTSLCNRLQPILWVRTIRQPRTRVNNQVIKRTDKLSAKLRNNFFSIPLSRTAEILMANRARPNNCKICISLILTIIKDINWNYNFDYIYYSDLARDFVIGKDFIE